MAYYKVIKIYADAKLYISIKPMINLKIMIGLGIISNHHQGRSYRLQLLLVWVYRFPAATQ